MRAKDPNSNVKKYRDLCQPVFFDKLPFPGFCACVAFTTKITFYRTRSCVSSKSAIEVDPIYCYDVEDYHAVAGLPSVEQQSQICPACIPTLPPVAPPQVDPPLPNDGPKVEVKLLEDDGTLTGSSNLVQNRNRGLEMSLNLTDTETESSDNVLTSSIIPSSYQQTLNITLASSAAHSQTSEDASLASLFATKSVSVTSRTASTLAEIAIEKTTVKPSAIFATYTLSNTSTDTRRNATSSVTQSAIVASLLATKSILITETLETATKIGSSKFDDFKYVRFLFKDYHQVITLGFEETMISRIERHNRGLVDST